MKKFLISLSTVVVAVAALGSPSVAETFKRIGSEGEFREAVVDRKLTLGDGWVIIKSTGETEGVILDKKFRATWRWENEMYCRDAVLGNRKLGDDCQVVKVSDRNVQFTGGSGGGKSSEWALP